LGLRLSLRHRIRGAVSVIETFAAQFGIHFPAQRFSSRNWNRALRLALTAFEFEPQPSQVYELHRLEETVRAGLSDFRVAYLDPKGAYHLLSEKQADMLWSDASTLIALFASLTRSVHGEQVCLCTSMLLCLRSGSWMRQQRVVARMQSADAVCAGTHGQNRQVKSPKRRLI
jgi:hypothetical protein